MQSQFEMNVYKYQLFISLVLMYLLYFIRNPTRFELVDLFVYIRDIVYGFSATFIHSWVGVLIAFDSRTGSICSCIYLLALCMTVCMLDWSYTPIPFARSV